MDNPIGIESVKSFLLTLLKENSELKSIEWLLLQKDKIGDASSALKFFMAFSQASRFFSKHPLTISKDQLDEADNLVPGFRPGKWDLLQTARSFLMLHFQADNATEWVTVLDRLFETADLHEQQSLFAALPLMPFQEAMLNRAIDGLRTNITSVFDAIALDNPYPSRYFGEGAWNQMVVKAIFLRRPLYRIQNAQERANSNLAETLIDFAHERWSAGRTVMPELWRFVGPFLNRENIRDLEKVIQSGAALEKKAALLACSYSNLDESKVLLTQHPEIKKEIIKGTVNWESIGREFENTD